MIDNQTSGVEMFWEEKFRIKHLKFIFKGKLTTDAAEDAVAKWKKEFNSQVESDEKVVLIWNCKYMTDYDTGARKIWQNTLSELSDKIQDIWVVTSNPMMIMAVKTMSLLTKYKMKPVASELDIQYSNVTENIKVKP